MPKPRKPVSLTNILRGELAAVESVNAVAKELEISQTTLSRFLRGDTDSLTFEFASRLLDHFGYVVIKAAEAKGRPAKR